jgi:hypothetical protein
VGQGKQRTRKNDVNYLRNTTRCGELLVIDRGAVRGVVSNGSAPSCMADRW